MVSNGDLQNELKTYHAFLSLMKWGLIICLIVAAFVVYLISKS